MTAATACGARDALYEQLHRRFAPGAFDNWVVWAGNLTIDVDGLCFDATLARAYVGEGKPAPTARVRVELFVGEIPIDQVRAEDLDARVWTDVNDREEGSGRYLPMRLVCDDEGHPVPSGNNLVLESEPLILERTGVFSYTAELSADGSPVGAGQKSWITINEMADNRDGMLVVSPSWVQACPTLMEVCARKTGAARTDGSFRSGRLRWVTDHLEEMPVDVVYLLPFFRPGCGDVHTGTDVRKGTLGSVYAVSDFYQVDPDLVTPPEETDLPALVAAGLLTDGDVADVFARVPDAAAEISATSTEGASVAQMALVGGAEAIRRWGRERMVQLVARAELRALTRRAHELGKRVIFDLVLMQTSRDSHLIAEQPEWYLRDEDGRPRIHQIAWLVYSDVALFDLVHNEPLQAYLMEVSPYWIETCDLDGVRIDASQTVDRPFLKRIKNRINAVKEDALVLGETLCPLAEAVDVPVDMVYALMVDFHRDADRAGPLIQFLEEVHGQFAAGTVAMAYFENHDSPRATRIWHERFTEALSRDRDAARYWSGVSLSSASRDGGQVPDGTHVRDPEGELTRHGVSVDWPAAMALLKNLQATLINCTAGMGAMAGSRDDGDGWGRAVGTQLTYALEFGSDWGEETRTDFENETLLHHDWRQRHPHERLVRTYEDLQAQRAGWSPIGSGQVYYHRNEMDGGDGDDAVLGYVRHDGQGALLLLHNLDFCRTHRVTYRFDYLARQVGSTSLLFDSYVALGLEPPPDRRGAAVEEDGAAADGSSFTVLPLQSRIIRLY